MKKSAQFLLKLFLFFVVALFVLELRSHFMSSMGKFVYGSKGYDKSRDISLASTSKIYSAGSYLSQPWPTAAEKILNAANAVQKFKDKHFNPPDLKEAFIGYTS